MNDSRFWARVRVSKDNSVGVHENTAKEAWYEAYHLMRSAKRIHQHDVTVRIYDEEAYDDFKYPRINMDMQGNMFINRK